MLNCLYFVIFYHLIIKTQTSLLLKKKKKMYIRPDDMNVVTYIYLNTILTVLYSL